MLGSGACGSVHELTAPPGSKSSKSSSPAWAVKVAPLPKSAASSTGKKRKKTPAERNADLILHEYTTLQNAGSQIRGTIVPEISFMGDPPAYGETEDKSEYTIISIIMSRNHPSINPNDSSPNAINQTFGSL